MRTALGVMLAGGLAFLASPARAQQKHAVTFGDMSAMARISEPAISPDGRWVAYTVATPDLAANGMPRNIWLASTSGDAPPRALTSTGKDSRPQWSPDSSRIAFLSGRAGTPQVYVMPISGGG